jgi:hypothetical protein
MRTISFAQREHGLLTGNSVGGDADAQAPIQLLLPRSPDREIFTLGKVEALITGAPQLLKDRFSWISFAAIIARFPVSIHSDHRASSVENSRQRLVVIRPVKLPLNAEATRQKVHQPHRTFQLHLIQLCTLPLIHLDPNRVMIDRAVTGMIGRLGQRIGDTSDRAIKVDHKVGAGTAVIGRPAIQNRADTFGSRRDSCQDLLSPLIKSTGDSARGV